MAISSGKSRRAGPIRWRCGSQWPDSAQHSARDQLNFLYGQLRKKMGGWPAHLVAALAFAAHHLVVTLQFFPVPLAIFLAFCVAIGGLIWSWMYERHGGLPGAWISHLIVDVMLIWVGYQLIFT